MGISGGEGFRSLFFSSSFTFFMLLTTLVCFYFAVGCVRGDAVFIPFI